MSKLNSFIGGLLLGGVLLGVIGYFSEGFQKNPFENTTNTSEDSGLTTDSIISDGISVKALNTKDNGDGTVTKTFTYTVQPETATNQEITVKAQYVGGEDCSEVITVTVDTSQKTVSVLNKADFDKQVEVILTSVDNPSATAKVTCDYVKKVKEINITNDLTSVTSFNEVGGFIKPTYSKFTKDKDYTFTFSDITLESMFQGNQWFDMEDEDLTITNSIVALIKEKITSMTTIPTAEEIFNVSDRSDYHSYLVNNHDASDWMGGPFQTKLTMKITCGEIVKNIDNAEIFYGDTQLDFSPFTIDVDSIAPEVPSIEF